jgi:ABC-type branched-subunit amino acid transport system substrate-binding protein
LFAFRMAVDEANANVTFLPSTRIEPVWADTRSDSALTITNTYDLIQGGAVAIVGEYLSGLCQLIQYVCAHFSVPQISPSATAVDFTTKHGKHSTTTRKMHANFEPSYTPQRRVELIPFHFRFFSLLASTYPYFMRNMPQVGLQAVQMAQMIFELGWRRVGLVYTSDAFGAGGAAEFTAACARLNLDILVSTSFNIATTDVGFQVSRLAQSDARIMVYWGVVGDLTTLWRAMSRDAPQLLQDGYQWVLCHGVTVPALYTDAAGAIIPDMAEWAAGAIGLQYDIDPTRPAYKQFVEYYRSRPEFNLTSSVRPSHPAVPLYAILTYDATRQILLGIRHMIINLQLDPTLLANRPAFYAACLQQRFEGASGTMQLDATGDRVSGFAVVNFKRSDKQFVSIGRVGTDGKLTLSTASRIEYAGSNPDAQPLDHAVRGLLHTSRSVQVGLVTCTCILLALLLVVQVAIVRWRHQAVLKASSPLFLVLFIGGVQLLCASVIPRALENSASSLGSATPCVADTFLRDGGYTLLVGALLVKTVR